MSEVTDAQIKKITDNSTKETYRAKALTLLGAGDFVELFEDFATSPGNALPPPDWTPVVASGGTIETPTQPTDGCGGIARLRSNASANGSYILIGGRNPIANIITAKWYVAWRFRLGNTAAADVLATVACGVRENFATGKTITIGMFKALSTANFVLQYDGVLAGTGVSLGVALDNTTMHVAELWGVASTTVNGRLDGGSLVSGVMAAAPSAGACTPAAIAANGGTAADRDVYVDWAYMRVVRG
jgi:hypothetical protein